MEFCLKKGKTFNSEYDMALLDRIGAEIKKKYDWIRWIMLWIVYSPTVSPNMAHSDYCLFAGMKKIFQGKKLGSNEEISVKVRETLEWIYHS